MQQKANAKHVALIFVWYTLEGMNNMYKFKMNFQLIKIVLLIVSRALIY